MIHTAERFQRERYCVERVERDGNFHFRIADGISDSRIATCYIEENAHLIVAALNAHLSPTESNESALMFDRIPAERSMSCPYCRNSVTARHLGRNEWEIVCGKCLQQEEKRKKLDKHYNLTERKQKDDYRGYSRATQKGNPDERHRRAVAERGPETSNCFERR